MDQMRLYTIKLVFFPGLQTNEQRSYQYADLIVIGGDRGNVEATHALNKTVDGEAGVMLYDVDFITTLDLDVDTEEDEIREVVQASYNSIQAEAFTQSIHFPT